MLSFKEYSIDRRGLLLKCRVFFNKNERVFYNIIFV